MTAPTLLERLRRPITRVNADVALLCEAALEAAKQIESLQAQNTSLRDDLRESERSAREEIRGAVAEARWQAQQGEDYGSM